MVDVGEDWSHFESQQCMEITNRVQQCQLNGLKVETRRRERAIDDRIAQQCQLNGLKVETGIDRRWTARSGRQQCQLNGLKVETFELSELGIMQKKPTMPAQRLES